MRFTGRFPGIMGWLVPVPGMEFAGEGMGAGGTGGVPAPPLMAAEVDDEAEKVATCGVTCSGMIRQYR